jgi:non-heme chloroperoxidase
MSTGHVRTKDNVDIFFKDWGAGQPVVFSHGWPLTADTWDDAMMFVARHGFRGIAHDRRGGGRSSQPWDGNDLDTYADDLWAVIESLDLNDIVLVGHSTGGGEVTRYVGRHGTSRVAKMVLVSAIPPFLRKTDRNPDGILDQFWQESMTVGLVGSYDCVTAIAETDLTMDLQAIDVPTLLIHGDDDQIVPIAISSNKSSKIIKGAEYKIYPAAPHGLTSTRKDQFHADLLAFLRS